MRRIRWVVMVAAALACSAARAQAASNPFATIALDAAYGGVAGALVGTGVGLIEDANLGRDILIGAGAGVIAGAIVGVVLVMRDRQRYARSLELPERPPRPQRAVAWDGLGRTVRDPVFTAPSLGLLAGRF